MRASRAVRCRTVPFTRGRSARKSRQIVYRLAALFSLDAFAGGLVVQSLLALWLFERFDMSLSAAGLCSFWSGLLSAFSFPAAAWLSRQVGLINTMVFTHIPSSICLILAAFAPTLPLALSLLLARAALSQMDVPLRLRQGTVRLEDLVDDRQERAELRAHRGLRAPVPRRYRVLQDLRLRLAVDPEQPGSRSFAESIDMASSPQTRVEFHRVHPPPSARSPQARNGGLLLRGGQSIRPVPWPTLTPGFTGADRGQSLRQSATQRGEARFARPHSPSGV